MEWYVRVVLLGLGCQKHIGEWSEVIRVVGHVDETFMSVS